MKNSKLFFSELLSAITTSDSVGEKQSIVYTLLNHFYGLSVTEIISGREIEPDPAVDVHLKTAIERVNENEPIQYIINNAVFYRRLFLVDSSVLIPRPETEELVSEIIRELKECSFPDPVRILDIGTGSGCIPITLALEIPGSDVMATDISEVALNIARENILRHQVSVRLLHHDILSQKLPFKKLNVIVSNPPYIPYAEKEQMQSNVLDYEPHLALFVKNDNPLLFYQEIALQAKHALTRNGLLIFEINPLYANEVEDLLKDVGFSGVKSIPDISGKARMVRGIWSTV